MATALLCVLPYWSIYGTELRSLALLFESWVFFLDSRLSVRLSAANPYHFTTHSVVCVVSVQTTLVCIKLIGNHRSFNPRVLQVRSFAPAMYGPPDTRSAVKRLVEHNEQDSKRRLRN